MCVSKLGQIVYGTFALGAVMLIFVFMFTSGWRKVQADLKNGSSVKELVNMGLLSVTCFTDKPYGSDHLIKAQFDNCIDWYNNRPTWEKVAVAGMILALLASVVAFVWNLLTFCACFCHGTIHKPLVALALNAAVLLGVSLALFYYNNRNHIETIDATGGISGVVDQIDGQNDASYRFYSAIGALALLIANVVVGSLIVCFADHCL